ncbi:MAG TPA: sigma-70 family RNA polymerase sigma factor [Myxococcota bacterium]|nr:sigma-70 family RNA polymerase sigma factor [Myxococcota bacterium]
MDRSDQPDERLVGALADDPSALGLLYDRYGSLVYGLALAILTKKDEAEDLTQEVFLSLHDHNRAFNPARGSLGAYLTTLTRSRAIDKLRGGSRRVRILRAQYEAEPALPTQATPMDEASSRETAVRVKQALADLPPNERRALELFYYQGMTQAEIAEHVGAPLGTVKSWCRRGLLGLRDVLGDLVE